MKKIIITIFKAFISCFKKKKQCKEVNTSESLTIENKNEQILEEPIVEKQQQEETKESQQIIDLIDEAVSKSRSQITEHEVMTKYIAKRTIELDEFTGLEREVRATNIIIDAEEEKISIILKEVLVSPTGIVMKVLNVTQYDRYNTDENKRYDNLEESEVGQGIKALVSNDLKSYPYIGQ